MGDLHSRSLFECSHQFKYRTALSCSHIEKFIIRPALPLNHPTDSHYMGTRQIDYIDVIADGRPIRGIVIISENTQTLPDSGSSLRNERDQISGNSFGQLSDQCGGMGSDRIKITQCDPIHFAVCRYRIAYDVLANLFCIAIGRSGRLAGRLLGDRQNLRFWPTETIRNVWPPSLPNATGS